MTRESPPYRHSVHALILWDVDHTLVENAGVSKETYSAAFRALAGFTPAVTARTNGRTDRLIMREMFGAHGLEMPPWQSVFNALQDAGAARLEAMRRRGSVLPGVREALSALDEVPGVVQSLLTGNILPNARMKMTALGLDNAVDFEAGAYGSDSDSRPDLVGVAQRRASAKYNRDFHSTNTILIGDTKRDIEAGRNGGAQVIAIATGAYTVAELVSVGYATVMDDLRDTGRLLAEVARLSSLPRRA